MKYDRRKLKRVINWYSKKTNVGKYVVDCRSHPCRVVEASFYTQGYPEGDISVVSLINGSGSSCSCYHCGPEPISESLAREMADFALNNSWEDYLMKYHGYTSETIEEYRKMDAIWGFQKA